MVSKTYTFTIHPKDIAYVLGPLREALTRAMHDSIRISVQQADLVAEARVLHEVIKQITDSHMSNDNASNSHD